MSGTVKRVDPRRPFRITADGVRRIVLGEIGSAGDGARGRMPAHGRGVKPLRTERDAERWVLSVVHSERGRLDDHARQALAAAAILATPETGVLAVVLGGLAEDLGPAGADRVLVMPEFDAKRFDPEGELRAVKTLIDQFDAKHVFMPDAAAGTGDLGRRLMADFGEATGARISGLDAGQAFVRWLPGAEFASTPLPRFILLEAGVVDSALPFRGRGEILSAGERASGNAATSARYRDLGLEAQDASALALEEADIIVAAGNGVHNVPTVHALAGLLGAAVGASRVAVDDGKFPRDKQIGATGKTVTASAYIAVGISGAVQHLQGIKDCRYVIAINKDASAPIVKRADLTLVGDAEELMQALLTRFDQAKRQSPEAS